jgi:hypothetical protein
MLRRKPAAARRKDCGAIGLDELFYRYNLRRQPREKKIAFQSIRRKK